MDIVNKDAPITGDQIAERLGVSKPTIRSDLAVLAMLGYVDAKPKVGYFAGHTARSGRVSTPSPLYHKVRDIQGVPIVIDGNTTVYNAIIQLFLENIGTLIVVDNEGFLEGIVSRKDFLKVTIGSTTVQTMPVHLVMTRHPNIITISPDDSVIEAARRMIHYQVDSLPVVQEAISAAGETKPSVIGRISKTHMTKLLLECVSEGG